MSTTQTGQKPMNDSHKTELLSAYLDREMSANEQAEIEQLLESDPQARQILEELSQLGDLLRDQPRQPMRSSFSADVMNRVRQQPAFGTPQATSAQAEQDPAGQQQEPANRDPAHQQVTLAKHENVMAAGGSRFKRPLIWGSLAAVAALLLLAYPMGLFNFFGNTPTENHIAIEEEDGNNGEIMANGSQDDETPDSLSPDQLVAEAEQENGTEPGSTPRQTPAQATPRTPQEQLVESSNIPHTNQAAPGSAPFVVNAFTAEDEKILRLLESLVLVKIECTPAAAKAREFDKILKKHKIKLAEKATPKQPANAPLPETEVYYIEASVEQAEAVLNEVNARNTEFTSITMRTETLQTKNTLNGEPAGNGAQPEDTPAAENQTAPAETAPAETAPAETAPADGKQPARPDDASAPEAKQGRGSFAEKFHLETPEQLAALRNNPGHPPSASSVLPFLQGQAEGLDAILGNSPVEAEHLVRMLVVIDTVKPKEVE